MIYELYPLINGTIATAMGNDTTEIFRYADLITHGLATMTICFALFLVTLMGSLVAQQRNSGNIRPETSLLAAFFVTTGFEIIMLQKNLVDGWLFILTLFGLIMSFIWVTFSTSDSG